MNMHLQGQQQEPKAMTAAQRNKSPICEVLEHVLPAQGIVFEVGSGTGEHALHFSESLSHLHFQPSEMHDAALARLEEHLGDDFGSGILKPVTFDLLQDHCPLDSVDAMIAINVIHIAPWAATLALLKEAARVLPAGAPLFFYGPFHRSDIATVESNCAFDAYLRTQNPVQGLRHLDDVTTHAHDAGFNGPQVIQMPANNLSVIFTKA
ncbi:MAG: DUF938 domain-containing protein [Pseudomonadota bacterium]